MALNNPANIEFPDGARPVVGNQGDVVAQEPSSGKQVHRRGGDESATDVNVGTVAEPRDLIADGDFSTGTRNTGGAEALAGEFVSTDSNAFNVLVDWLDADENVVHTHAPAPIQGVTDVDFSLRVRSDRWQLRVEDASGAGQNRVRGSANVH